MIPTCVFCTRSAPTIEQASADGWTPGFFVATSADPDNYLCSPVCLDCQASRLVEDDDGEWRLARQTPRFIVTFDEKAREILILDTMHNPASGLQPCILSQVPEEFSAEEWADEIAATDESDVLEQWFGAGNA